MGKFLAPNDGAREVDIRGDRGRIRYRGTSGGVYNVDNPAHIQVLKANGFTESGVSFGTATGRGFTCVKCGFEGWFRKCGKCGHEQPKDED